MLTTFLTPSGGLANVVSAVAGNTATLKATLTGPREFRYPDHDGDMLALNTVPGFTALLAWDVGTARPVGTNIVPAVTGDVATFQATLTGPRAYGYPDHDGSVLVLQVLPLATSVLGWDDGTQRPMVLDTLPAVAVALDTANAPGSPALGMVYWEQTFLVPVFYDGANPVRMDHTYSSYETGDADGYLQFSSGTEDGGFSHDPDLRWKGGVLSVPGVVNSSAYFASSAQQVVTADATIIAGRVKFRGSTASQTLTLPVRLLCGVGADVFVRNGASVAVTLAAGAGETIEEGASIVLAPGESVMLTLMSDNASYYDWTVFN